MKMLKTVQKIGVYDCLIYKKGVRVATTTISVYAKCNIQSFLITYLLAEASSPAASYCTLAPTQARGPL